MYDDIGKLILRLTLGILMLLHGIAKLRYGVSGIEGMVSSHGLPGFLAYGVFVGEVIAPLMVIAGWNTRIGGIIIAINMIVAIALAHSTQLFAIGKGDLINGIKPIKNDILNMIISKGIIIFI